MGKRNNSRTFEIALSAISCAVAAGALALGLLSGWLVGTGYVIAVVALMVPLSKQFFWGDFLAYLATVILAVVLGAARNFWDLVPFAMFFGLHPLVNCLQIRFNINRWLAFAIKAVWFDCTLIAGYFLIYVLGGIVLPEQVQAVIDGWRLYVIIFTVGTALFLLYDYLIFKIQIGVNKLVYRIRK
ncbi:MAG: hypothetical protein K2N22_01655 [Clostridia bacterium]|nr:hypothetical protein [Clostridia bacterium]